MLEGGRNNHNQVAGVESFDYFNHNANRRPLTLIDANKVAVAIASNNNIKNLDLYDKFDERGSFECVFNVVLARDRY